eukprot:CAMPEP_0185036958 /NCGR_PEP_ID=MMETSP1103-20130426/30731_1 /TAXON_ID=36769 /ORGANISM="Paraphysomonas bandaiensis, Strain Caron Lab Isolate" /LENGTH=349 /DNA_ID=CAMNT_0027574733 /DNA_START=203 /DNA_END=1252 /DNA_ORIENTATION=+
MEENAGKMTKFKSLDEIPDLGENYEPTWNDDDDHYESPEPDDDDNDYDYSYQSHGNQSYQPDAYAPPPLPAECNRGVRFASPDSYSPHRNAQYQHRSNDVPRQEHVESSRNYRQSYDGDYSDFSDNSDDDDEPPQVPSVGRKQLRNNHHHSPQKVSNPRNGRAKNVVNRGMPTCDPSPIRYEAPERSVRSSEEQLYFERQPRDVNYKPYTLQDYKKIKPQNYVELGKLKPDLNTEELVAKRANAERIKEFSKNLHHYNKQAMPRRDQSAEDKKKKEVSRREKALQFAQNIPKPKVKPNAQLESGGSAKGASNVGMGTQAAVESSRLEELTSKHLQSKKQVDAIKKSLGL